ncbi:MULTISPECIES: hypothetical protein [unclassified Kitasatospora]|uniref:hypothetical protein n=1 Tax=unclassified Kitasatospora TaxID=2633591 RepID=UPI00070F64AC|nr:MULTISPECIES: hypothetical protein [unclassified Kitasatospora]KQV11700.1 hypothetical protein ASC99_09600 [Kitasatospora sp. Root107]KRB76717.1 hypothetical protein ASE03_13780 [Kitasatospora sp. Root187]
MSTGNGGGAGYRVEVDNLRAFASQVRGLLDEFQARADGSRTHGQSGVGRSAFGTFPEAQALFDKYEVMRDSLRDVMNYLQDTIDEAQRKADLTAGNYEEQETETTRGLKVNSDGWSVGGTTIATQVGYSSSSSRPGVPQSSPNPPAGATPAGSGEPQSTW